MTTPTWYILLVDGVPVAQSLRSEAIDRHGWKLGIGRYRITTRWADAPLDGVEVLP